MKEQIVHLHQIFDVQLLFKHDEIINIYLFFLNMTNVFFSTNLFYSLNEKIICMNEKRKFREYSIKKKID